MKPKTLSLNKETLRLLNEQQGGEVHGGAVRTNQDSICIRCFSRPVFDNNTVIVGNTCIQD